MANAFIIEIIKIMRKLNIYFLLFTFLNVFGVYSQNQKVIVEINFLSNNNNGYFTRIFKSQSNSRIFSKYYLSNTFPQPVHRFFFLELDINDFPLRLEGFGGAIYDSSSNTTCDENNTIIIPFSPFVNYAFGGSVTACNGQSIVTPFYIKQPLDNSIGNCNSILVEGTEETFSYSKTGNPNDWQQVTQYAPNGAIELSAISELSNYSGILFVKGIRITSGEQEYGQAFPSQTFETNIITYNIIPCPPTIIAPPTIVNNICSNSNAGSATFTFDRDLAAGEYFNMTWYRKILNGSFAFVSSEQITQSQFINQRFSIQNLAQGTYYLRSQTFLNDPLVPTSNTNSPEFDISAPPSVTFTNLPYITTTNPPVNIKCKGDATGTITITATGGSGSFQYSKDNGANWQNSTVFSGLVAGAYQIVVKDSNGCIAPAGVQTVTLTEPSSATTFISTVVNPSENNVADGQISVLATGGTFPLVFNWVNTANPTVSIGSTNSITGISAGSYTLTTTDANLCTKAETFILTNPPLLVPTLTLVTPVRCFGENTAKLQITAVGGVPNNTVPFYIYTWKKNGVAIAAQFPEYDSLVNMGAGIYEVTVKDANNVTKIVTLTITQPNVLNATSSSTPVSCNGGTNGTIDLTVTGGTAPYTYLWSNGATTQDLTNLSAGSYSCVVTDARGGTYSFTSGCTFTTIGIQVTQPQFSLSALEIVTPIATAGSSTGGIAISVIGGTPNYAYLWSPGGESTSSISGKPAGAYSVTITDSKGCTLVKSYILSDPAPLAVVLTQTGNILCNGVSNGVAVATAIGGQGPFTYQWTKNGVAFLPLASQTATTSTQQTLSNLEPAIYQVTVVGTPVNTGNTATSSALTISQPNPIAISPVITNVNCFGASTGAINISTSGGTGTYTYEWYKNSNPTIVTTAQNVTGISSGGYTVFITDQNNCSKNFVLTVTQPTVLGVTATTVNPTSFGGSNGSVNATVTGGMLPYSYSWTNGSTVEDLVNIPAGIYTLTVTDANGCSAQITKTLIEPSLLTASLTNTLISCNGGSASLTVNVSGGISPYTYIWKKGNTIISVSNSTTTITNQTAGSYTVIVNDNAVPSVQVMQTLTLTQPNILSATASSTDVTCFGSSNGSINLTLSGGTSPYTKSWKNALGTVISTLEDPAGLQGGVYSCDIIDTNGCTFQLSGVSISAPTAIVASIIVTNPITAAGSATGALSTVVSGGISPYTYLWSTTATSSNLSSIPAGNYSVSITDANGCTGTASIVLNDLPVLAVTISQLQNVSCYQGSNGNLKANVTGGNTFYSYVWKKNGIIITNQTSQFVNNIGAGNYQVIVTDGYGNTTSSTLFNVTEPTAVTATTQITNVACYGGTNGSVALTLLGGTAPYTYKWFNGTQISTSQNLQNVASGTYSVWIYDANNCGPLIINNLTITQPSQPLSVSLIPTNVSGFGLSNGAIVTTVSGGTSPYTYSWSSGQTSQNLTAIPSGNYTLTVTDFNGCQVVSNAVFISQPTQLAATVNLTTAILCNGNSNGSLTANPSGGSGNYTYLWSNGAITQAINGLLSGSYSVVVKDSNLNQITAGYNLTQPSSLTANYSTTPILCNASGSLTINPLGGSGTYAFLWNTGATTQTISVPSFATFNCTVTDSNGCSFTLNNIQPTQTSTLTISPTVIYNPILITGGTGGIDITVTGGTTPYSFSWSNGTNTQDLVNVISGTYSVTITDASGCVQIGIFTLSPPIPLSVTISQQNFILCNGASTAQIKASPLGGQPSYSFVWKKNGTVINPIQSNSILSGISAGNYEVIITDANNISITSAVFVVNEPTLLLATTNITNVNCFGGSTGGVILSVFGGTTPYTFTWKNSFGATISTSQNLQNVASGVYSVTITDANNCTPLILNAITITQPSQPLSISFQNTNVTGFGLSNGSINATILGGTTPYTFSWGSGQVTEDLINISAGNFTLTVTDNNGCVASLTTTLSQPNAILTDILVVNPISCNGDSNGNLIANVQGGVNPYIYLWKKGTVNVGTSQSINNLNAGVYTLIVTDANGNQTTTNYSLLQPSVLTATYVSTPILCNNGLGGSLTLVPNGGTAPYTFQWSTGQTTATLNNVIAGSYVAEITDSKGCSFTLLGIHIAQPAPLVLTALVTPVLVTGASTGAIDVTISGGTIPYTYLWSSGETTQDIQNKPTGIYTLVVTDANGCSKTITDTIIQTTILSASISVVQALNCNGNSNGILNAIPSGGQAPFSFFWKRNGNTMTANTQQVGNLTAGNYQATIADSTGAIFTSPIFPLLEPAALISNYLVASQIYKDENIILINVSNNVGETYNWIVPNEATLVSVTPQTIVMKFNQIGSFSVGLQTTNVQGCSSITNKQIVVEQNPGLPISPGSTNLVDSFLIFPNPVQNNGTFTVKINLSQQNPISLTIYNAVSGVLINQLDLPSAVEHSQDYNLILSSGVYWIILRTCAGVQAKKLIVN